nr:class I adenylate-forming enzyme family protein [Chitinivorax tropicus]
MIRLGNAVLESTRFGPDATIDSLPEWSSLKHVQLLNEMAREFGVNIPLEDAYRFDSYHRLLALVRQQVGVATAAGSSMLPDTIGKLFQHQVARQPGAPFLIFPRDGTSETYQSFYAIVCAAAQQLAARGLVAGDRLGLLAPNGPEWIACFLAAQLLGVAVVPINPTLAPREIADLITHAEPRLTLFDRQLVYLHTQLQQQLPNVQMLLAGVVSGFGIEALREQREATLPTTAKAREGDGAVLQYTSGSGGYPRGVVLTHHNLLQTASALVNWFGLTGQSRTLCMLPLFHGNAQVANLLAPMVAGGSTVVLDSKSALTSFWKMIDVYQVHWTSVQPAMLSALQSFRLPRFDRSLKGIISTGQALPDDVRLKFETEYQVPVYQAYGLAETCAFACINRYPAGLRQSGSMGVPLPGCEMRVVDEEGNELPDGQTGQILVRGDNVASHYHHEPALTEQRFRDGWLHTGDYGCRNSDGHFYFAMRLDDLIERGGEHFYPAEIENVLHACEQVVTCVALGVPDPILGQEICVYVELQPGATWMEADIRQYLITHLARFKQPSHVVIINQLADMKTWPRSASGKILRRKLREHFLHQHLSGDKSSAKPTARSTVSAVGMPRH